MNDKIKFVLNGFQSLTRDEKKEFFNLIKDFDTYPNLTESDIKDAIGLENISEGVLKSKSNSVVFGPSPTGCSCCGR